MLLRQNRIINFQCFPLKSALTLIILFSATVLFLGCAATTSPKQTEASVLLLNKWNGDFPVSQLPRLPAGQQQSAVGYIDDMATFIFLWRAYMPDTILPAVDFSKDFVVFTRNVTFYNRQSILAIKLKDTTAEIIVLETKSTRPVDDKVSMAMAVIPRAGITAIKSGTEIIQIKY
jgi:hypothetical protein